jgi:hypothetical protein
VSLLIIKEKHMSGVSQVEATKHKVVKVAEPTGSQGVEKIKVQKIPTAKFQSIPAATAINAAKGKESTKVQKKAEVFEVSQSEGVSEPISIPSGKEIVGKTSSLSGLNTRSTKSEGAVALFYMSKIDEVLAIDEQIKELRAQRSEIMNETKKVATKAATNELIKLMKMDEPIRQDKLSELFKVLQLSSFVDFSISSNGFYSDTLFSYVQDEIKHLEANGDFTPAPLPESSKKVMTIDADNGEADAESGVVH